MTATNHAVTGAIIGLSVSNPVLALMLAFLSHFVLDAFPHFGNGKWKFNGWQFQAMLALDISLCFLLALLIFSVHPANWFIVDLCAFLATSPDFAWVPDYLFSKKRTKKPKYGAFRKFAANIQWYQKPFGALLEAAWLLLTGALLYGKLF